MANEQDNAEKDPDSCGFFWEYNGCEKFATRTSETGREQTKIQLNSYGLRKRNCYITKQLLTWNRQCKRKRGDQNTCWRRDLVADITQVGLSWQDRPGQETLERSCAWERSEWTWGMTAPGGKTAPSPVDNLKLPRTFTEYTEWWYHLPDTCFERRTPRSSRKLKYSIFNIYTCFDVIFPIIIHVTVICIFVIIKNVIHHANT